MTKQLLALPHATLEALATALQAGRLSPPYGAMGVARFAPGAPAEDVAAELTALAARGLTPEALGAALHLVVTDRAQREKAATGIQLVWTGPEVPGSRSRDTAVVVGELLAQAERRIVVAAYALFQGRQMLAPLAARMEERPDLEVRMFLNAMKDPAALDAADTVSRFAADFRKKEWPGKRLPEVYYDPRALETTKEKRAVLHAKCVVVDTRRSLVTSANFTEAAHERNIEAGVLVDDPAFAAALEYQFSSLVTAGILKRLPV